MNSTEALNNLAQAAAEFKGTAKEHMILQESIMVLGKELELVGKPTEPAKPAKPSKKKTKGKKA